MSAPRPVEVVGAGPAGLGAAITLARSGHPVTVFERHADVGHRFHGDFQGLENWTTEGDVLEDLAAIGIESTFEHTPFREVTWFDAEGREYRFRSSRPLWYLVRRGASPGTLDTALRDQGVSAGARIEFGSARAHLPAGGIVAHGPHRPDAVAAGYVFNTDRADLAMGVASDRLAPKGYAYLLIAGGRGTVASCMFDDFHNEQRYLEHTVAFFRDKAGFRMDDPRPFGGFGNVIPALAASKGKLLYVGEAAGFQDALFGFGMGYAIRSGHLAARAWLSGDPGSYEHAWRAALGRQLRTGVVNRMLYARLGDRGYGRLLASIRRAPDPREWLRRYYRGGVLKRLLFPTARRLLARPSPLIATCPEGCVCTWCRCRHQAAEPVFAPTSAHSQTPH